MDHLDPKIEDESIAAQSDQKPYDYTYVSAVSRIALYDDLLSAPQVTEIMPAETAVYIENLASKVYELARTSGGSIPYTVIREVSENFIHANFKEIIISILDRGNTIRFADQGPGINHKEKAQLPGFSSAIEPMKKYIRGVGSGLPIVREYLEFSHGNISIEDNMGAGSVVTISLDPERAGSAAAATQEPPHSNNRGDVYTQANNTPFAAEALQAQREEHTLGYGHQTAASNGYAFAQQSTQPSQFGQVDQGFYQHGPIGQQHYAPQQPMGLAQDPAVAAYYAAHEAGRVQMAVAPLSQRERDFLSILFAEGALGVTEISKLTDVPNSSTYVALKKLEEAGLVEKTAGQKRVLTPMGHDVAQTF